MTSAGAHASLDIDRFGRAIVVRGLLANLAGAAVTFVAIGFLIPVLGRVDDIARLGLINGPLVLVDVLVSATLAHMRFAKVICRETEWIAAGRVPTADEHARTLRLAVTAVRLELVGWLLAGVIFAVLNAALFSIGFGAAVGATVWLGGETVAAIDYLQFERILRPLTAAAIAASSGTRRTPGIRAQLAMTWMLGTGVPLVGVVVVAIISLVRPGVASSYVAAAALFLSAVAIVSGVVAARLSARSIDEPLLELRDAIGRIARGDLDVRVAVDDLGEIGMLQVGFNQMTDGLRERRRIRDLFGRQVGEDVARAALERGVALGGEEREIAALFIDIVGSTSMAQRIPPTGMVALLNQFFAIVVAVVTGERGIVNKFEGDAALCVFGAPADVDDAAGHALAAARTLAARLTAELPEVDFGVGVSAGVAVAGNVGAEHRFEYTVIGDPVNEAARLADLAKQRPERVLASDAALARATPQAEASWASAGSAVLRGRATPTRLAHPRG